MKQKTKEEIGKELYRLPLLENLMQIYSVAFIFVSFAIHPLLFLATSAIFIVVVIIAIIRKRRDWKIYFKNPE